MAVIIIVVVVVLKHHVTLLFLKPENKHMQYLLLSLPFITVVA